MSGLSNESVEFPHSGFVDGVEFEETFADAAPAPAPAPTAPPRLTLVPSEPEEPTQRELDRRLREAEAMVKDAVERLRIAEEQRLAEWANERRLEEERRLAKWAEERRGSIERSLEQKQNSEPVLARRIEAMLAEWQTRFEQRLDQRRAEEDRVAERRRQADEERLRAWRGELEQALSQRFGERPTIERALTPPSDPNAAFRAALSAAASVRDAGRVIRDALADVARANGFALAIHGSAGDIAYRYRVASEDELGALLRRETLDDGPESVAAHSEGWVRSQRPARVGGRNIVVHLAQRALRVDDRTIGVVTLHTAADALDDDALARGGEMLDVATARLATLRASGSYRAV